MNKNENENSEQTIPPLSLKNALRQTHELWTWLSNNPGASKSEWPGWRYGQDPTITYVSSQGFTTYQHSCPCCEYTARLAQYYARFPICQYCPLVALWGDNSYACCEDTSPYVKWESLQNYTLGDIDPESEKYNEVLEQLSELAKKIADAAKCELAKLEDVT